MKKVFKKQNWPLIVAICIPFVLIILVVLSVYLPNVLVKPKYDFLFEVGGYGQNGALPIPKTTTAENPNAELKNYDRFAILNGKLTKEIVKYEDDGYLPNYNPQLYLYDQNLRKSVMISFEDAQKLQIDEKKTSADGYEIGVGSSESGFFPFFFSSNDYSAHYITGHNVSRRLNLPQPTLGDNYYDQGFRFLGWIIK